MAEPWKVEKQKAEEITQLVHEAVRLLKMGDTAVISVGKFTEDEVRWGMWRYALHKGKWFDSEYDKTTRVFRVQRGLPLPDRQEEMMYDEEEEE